MNAKSADHQLGWHKNFTAGCPRCEQKGLPKMSAGSAEEANRMAREALEKTGLNTQSVPTAFAQAFRDAEEKRDIGTRKEDETLPNT